MSEIKNDPSGKKQILVSFIANVIAIGVLVFSVSGASLKCTEAGECEIHRKNIFTESQDTFNWKQVQNVKYSVGSEGYSTNTNRRGAFTTNLLLSIGEEKKIPIFVSGVAWTFGKLDRTKLQTSIDSGKIETPLWAISFGGAALFISIIFGSIGFFFLLFRIITPIIPNMPEKELQKARKTNLVRFLLLLAGSCFQCFSLIGYLTFAFAAGL